LAEHKIAGNLQIGGIYECNFGSYKSINGGTTEQRDEADSSKLDYRIPNEMIKCRPVIVISKHRGVCTVIPVSTTREKEHKNPKKDPIKNGICVPLQGFIPTTHFYDSTTPCWGVCYSAQTVDIGRLRDIFDKSTGKHVSASVTADILLKLRFGVVKAIGLPSLVPQIVAEEVSSATSDPQVVAEEISLQ
jgi:uncharacterized protein YifN (PemK superfamily)